MSGTPSTFVEEAQENGCVKESNTVNAEDVDDAALDELVGQNHDPTLRPFAARCFMAGRAVRYQELQAVRTLLAAAERLIMAHHDSAIHQVTPGTICQVCAGEHGAVQAIWRELHQPDEE